jgi:hypothetical protein
MHAPESLAGKTVLVTGATSGIDFHTATPLARTGATVELARRLEGNGVVANALDPGTAWTAMTRGTAPRSMPLWLALGWPLLRLYQRRGSPAKAAQASIFLASAPEAGSLNGAYVGSDARPSRPSAAALDRANQERAFDLVACLVASAATAVCDRARADGTGAGAARTPAAAPASSLDPIGR